MSAPSLRCVLSLSASMRRSRFGVVTLAPPPLARRPSCPPLLEHMTRACCSASTAPFAASSLAFALLPCGMRCLGDYGTSPWPTFDSPSPPLQHVAVTHEPAEPRPITSFVPVGCFKACASFGVATLAPQPSAERLASRGFEPSPQTPSKRAPSFGTTVCALAPVRTLRSPLLHTLLAPAFKALALLRGDDLGSSLRVDVRALPVASLFRCRGFKV